MLKLKDTYKFYQLLRNENAFTIYNGSLKLKLIENFAKEYNISVSELYKALGVNNIREITYWKSERFILAVKEKGLTESNEIYTPFRSDIPKSLTFLEKPDKFLGLGQHPAALIGLIKQKGEFYMVCLHYTSSNINFIQYLRDIKIGEPLNTEIVIYLQQNNPKLLNNIAIYNQIENNYVRSPSTWVNGDLGITEMLELTTGKFVSQVALLVKLDRNFFQKLALHYKPNPKFNDILESQEKWINSTISNNNNIYQALNFERGEFLYFSTETLVLFTKYPNFEQNDLKNIDNLVEFVFNATGITDEIERRITYLFIAQIFFKIDNNNDVEESLIRKKCLKDNIIKLQNSNDIKLLDDLEEFNIIVQQDLE